MYHIVKVLYPIERKIDKTTEMDIQKVIDNKVDNVIEVAFVIILNIEINYERVIIVIYVFVKKTKMYI